MSKRRIPPSYLTANFHEEALGRYLFYPDPQGTGNHPLALYYGGPACWLKQFDPLDRPCSGDLEAFHFIGRQRIRNVFGAQLRTDLWAPGAIDPADVEDLVELAEWDPRNGGPGCTGHHRRLDGHSTPELRIPIAVLFEPVFDFIADYGFEGEAERKFDRPELKVAGTAAVPASRPAGVAREEVARSDDRHGHSSWLPGPGDAAESPLDVKEMLDDLGDRLGVLPSSVAEEAKKRQEERAKALKVAEESRAEEAERADRAIELMKAAPGSTAEAIAKEMGVKPNFLYRILGDLEKEGRIAKDGRAYNVVEEAVARLTPTQDPLADNHRDVA